MPRLPEPYWPNASTRITLLDVRDRLGLFRLVPRTGRKHQLRLHSRVLLGRLQIVQQFLHRRAVEIRPRDERPAAVD